jgi:hypothetical protein
VRLPKQLVNLNILESTAEPSKALARWWHNGRGVFRNPEFRREQATLGKRQEISF